MSTDTFVVKSDGCVFVEVKRRWRFAGRLDKTGKVLVTHRDPARHLFKKADAYGFNYDLIKNGGFEFVTVREKGGRELKTTRRLLLEKGFIRNFGGKGYEPQIFLPRCEFGLDGPSEPGVVEGIPTLPNPIGTSVAQ